MRRFTTGWQGNPIGGILHRLNDARNNSWPNKIEFDDLSHPSLIAAYMAGATKAPFGFTKDLKQSDSSLLSIITDPFTGIQHRVIAKLSPDLTVIHAHRADRLGKVQLEGITGATKEAVFAAKTAVATVEEIVDEIPRDANGLVLPMGVVEAFSLEPKGAAPSYALGFYERDAAAYEKWAIISETREEFSKWLSTLP